MGGRYRIPDLQRLYAYDQAAEKWCAPPPILFRISHPTCDRCGTYAAWAGEPTRVPGGWTYPVTCLCGEDEIESPFRLAWGGDREFWQANYPALRSTGTIRREVNAAEDDAMEIPVDPAPGEELPEEVEMYRWSQPIVEWTPEAAAIAEKWTRGEAPATEPPQPDWSFLNAPPEGLGAGVVIVGDGPQFHPAAPADAEPPDREPDPLPQLPADAAFLAGEDAVFIPPTREWALTDLIDADYNPREITERELADLEDSIDEFGLVEDVVVNTHPDRRGVVVGGHQKLKILRAKGVLRVPCKELRLPLDRERELNVRLNANGGRFSSRLLAEGGYSREDLEAWGLPGGDLEAFDKAAAEFRASLEGGGEGAATEFPSIDPEVDTKYVCPRCHFEWN